MLVEGEFSCIVTLLIYRGDHSAAKAGVCCCGDIDRIACEAGEEGLGIEASTVGYTHAPVDARDTSVACAYSDGLVALFLGCFIGTAVSWITPHSQSTTDSEPVIGTAGGVLDAC